MLHSIGSLHAARRWYACGSPGRDVSNPSWGDGAGSFNVASGLAQRHRLELVLRCVVYTLKTRIICLAAHRGAKTGCSEYS